LLTSSVAVRIDAVLTFGTRSPVAVLAGNTQTAVTPNLAVLALVDARGVVLETRRSVLARGLELRRSWDRLPSRPS
jgi:hypothetical protein